MIERDPILFHNLNQVVPWSERHSSLGLNFEVWSPHKPDLSRIFIVQKLVEYADTTLNDSQNPVVHKLHLTKAI